MDSLLVLVWLLNLFDAVATAQWVTGGYMCELNPLMAWTLSISVWTFLGVKIALGSTGIVGVALMKPRPGCRDMAVVVSYFLAAVYGAIFVWHVFLFTSLWLK